MNKTFTEILAEQDEEFVYHIISTADIHNPERFSRVRYALLPYQIKSIEADSYLPWSKGNKKFPAEPNSPTYTIKLVTGLPVDCRSVIQTLAMATHIHVSHLMIEPENGECEVDLVKKPEEVGTE